MSNHAEDHDHMHIELRNRVLATVHVDEDTTVTVEHVYEPEGAGKCEDCGQASHDPGLVGLTLFEEDDIVSALMTAAQALVIAERLQRAASLILQSGEDVPDVEREAARFAPPAA